jgi:hypothetical protein
MTKQKSKIIEFIKFTVGGMHAWVKAIVNGKEIIIRKPVSQIPKELLK